MKRRADLFRSSLVKSYLEPQAPYPAVVSLTDAGIVPRTQNQMDLLQSIPPLTTTSGVLHTSCGGLDIAPEFEFSLAGQTGVVTVFLPDQIVIDASFTDSELTLQAETPFTIQYRRRGNRWTTAPSGFAVARPGYAG
jgi:hypothetical protein